MKLQATLLIAVFLVVSVTGIRDEADTFKQPGKIVYPQPDVVLSGELPYFVSIQIRGNHTCGGFIYNKEWVVTIASCVLGFTAEEVKVVAGEVSLIALDPGQHTYAVSSIIVYDLYNNATKLHDVALLQTADPIKPDVLNVTSGTIVTCILYREINTKEDSPIIMGFGQNFDNATAPAIQLRSGVINGLDSNCTEDYPEFNPNYMICAGTNSSASPCRFDEGSPLVQKTPINNVYTDVAVGIFSKNKGCESGKPSIFTRLVSYYNWFHAIAGYQEFPCVLSV